MNPSTWTSALPSLKANAELLSRRPAYEKKTNVVLSVGIRGPVFITLVYRLNSRLFSPSAKRPCDLLHSHLEQLIKNEGEKLHGVCWRTSFGV